MIRKEIHSAKQLIDILERNRIVAERRMKELQDYGSSYLNRRRGNNGRYYYYKRERGQNKYAYLGPESCDEVNHIREYRYLKKLLDIIERDRQVLGILVEEHVPADYDAVNDRLPELYRGARVKSAAADNKVRRKWKKEAEAYKARFRPFKPEELKVRTNDGTYVRSKSEGLIYNLLLEQGITFVYELPRRIGNKMYWPDFTILSEIDNETELYIEHQGMMSVEYYRDRFFEKLLEYWNDGYVQGLNIFFTFDGPDGGVDLTPVHELIRNRVRC